jgi:integrase
VLWLFLVNTGVRPGEAFALRWNNVDLVTRTAHIQHSIERGTRRVKATKTGVDRYVDLTPRLVKALDVLQTDVEKAAVLDNREAPELVFPSDAGTVLDGHNVAKRFRALVRRAGLPQFSIYDTRHTYASHSLLMGAPVTYVAKQLGHSKPTTTLQHYAHWIPSGDPGLAEKLEAWRAQASPKKAEPIYS